MFETNISNLSLRLHFPRGCQAIGRHATSTSVLFCTREKHNDLGSRCRTGANCSPPRWRRRSETKGAVWRGWWLRWKRPRRRRQRWPRSPRRARGPPLRGSQPPARGAAKSEGWAKIMKPSQVETGKADVVQAVDVLVAARRPLRVRQVAPLTERAGCLPTPAHARVRQARK